MLFCHHQSLPRVNRSHGKSPYEFCHHLRIMNGAYKCCKQQTSHQVLINYIKILSVTCDRVNLSSPTTDNWSSVEEFLIRNLINFMPLLSAFIDRSRLTGGGHNAIFESARSCVSRANGRIMVSNRIRLWIEHKPAHVHHIISHVQICQICLGGEYRYFLCTVMGPIENAWLVTDYISGTWNVLYMTRVQHENGCPHSRNTLICWW